MSRSARTCTALDHTVRERTVHATRAPLALFMGVLIAWMMGSRVQAETITVCLDGSCDHTSVQAAIDAATNGDVIEVSGETYLLEATIDPNGKAVTIRGAVDPEDGTPRTVLDGQGLHRVLQCISGEGPKTAFENLALRNGLGKDDQDLSVSVAGGAAVRNSSPVFRHCLVAENQANFGSALIVTGGSPRFIECRFQSNTVDTYLGSVAILTDSTNETYHSSVFTGCHFSEHEGTAFFAQPDTKVFFEDCSFTDNSGNSGGIFTLQNEIVLKRCRFSRNNATNRGGGIYAENTFLTVEDCEFTDNTADQWGGAVALRSGGFSTWDGCTFRGNESGESGGAISIVDQGLIMHRSWIIDNASAEFGGGLHSVSATASLVDCTIRGNTTSLTGGGLYAQGGTPILDGVNLCGNLPDQVFGVIEQPGNCISEECSECPIDWCPDDPEKTEPGECGCGVPETDSDGDGIPDCLTPPCPADLDGNGTVDGADLTLLLATWGCTGDGCIGDLDGSGTADGADLTVILSSWGACSN